LCVSVTQNISLGARLTWVYDVIASLLCLKLAWLQLVCVSTTSQWVSCPWGAKQATCAVIFVIIITKGYKLGLHTAVNTSQSSKGVIWMYCIINKQSFSNLRSTNSVRYELACVSVVQYTPYHTACWTQWIFWYNKTNYYRTGQFSNCLRVKTIVQECQ